MADKYRTVYRVWHADEFIGEYDARYYAEMRRDHEMQACFVPELGFGLCDTVTIQVVEINNETGEETDVT